MIKVTRNDGLDAAARQLQQDAEVLRKHGYASEAAGVEKAATDMRERAEKLRRGRPPGVRFA